MQPTGAAGDPRQARALPALQALGGSVDGKPSQAPEPPPPPRRRLEGDPVAIILAGMQYGEAPCVGFLGDRGWGKSRAMKAAARGWLARNPGVVLALDKAGGSGFEGQRRVSLSDLRLHPMAPEPRAVVFTGDLAAGLDPDPEEVAAFAWRLRATRTGSLVCVDELKWCARGGWWRKGIRWVPQTATEGRKHDVGLLWAAQSPQDAPREAIEESLHLVVGHMAGLGVRCLRDRDYLLGMPDGTLEALPGEETVPAGRGRCVILRRGQPWDGRFYRFP